MLPCSSSLELRYFSTISDIITMATSPTTKSTIPKELFSLEVLVEEVFDVSGRISWEEAFWAYTGSSPTKEIILSIVPFWSSISPSAKLFSRR